MSWPSTDLELALPNELDALRKLVRAAINTRRKFVGSIYEAEFVELDNALDEWASLYNDSKGGE